MWSRDVMYSVNKWRYHVDLNFVRKVEFACANVMQVLGYKVVSGKDELRKMNNKLVGKLATIEGKN